MRAFFLLSLAATSVWPAELVMLLAVERDGPVTVVYRTNQLATGKGELSIRWTDINGRLVDDRRAVSMRNSRNRSWVASFVVRTLRSKQTTDRR